MVTQSRIEEVTGDTRPSEPLPHELVSPMAYLGWATHQQ